MRRFLCAVSVVARLEAADLEKNFTLTLQVSRTGDLGAKVAASPRLVSAFFSNEPRGCAESDTPKAAFKVHAELGEIKHHLPK